MHKWVLSCTKNTSIVLCPNLDSMLLSVLISKSNRGIPNSQRCMDKHWHVVQLFEGFIWFNHYSLVSYQKIEDTPYSNQDVVLSCSNNLKKRCTSMMHRWVLLYGWSDIHWEVRISVVESTISNKNHTRPTVLRWNSWTVLHQDHDLLLIIVVHIVAIVLKRLYAECKASNKHVINVPMNI